MKLFYSLLNDFNELNLKLWLNEIRLNPQAVFEHQLEILLQNNRNDLFHCLSLVDFSVEYYIYKEKVEKLLTLYQHQQGKSQKYSSFGELYELMPWKHTTSYYREWKLLKQMEKKNYRFYRNQVYEYYLKKGKLSQNTFEEFMEHQVSLKKGSKTYALVLDQVNDGGVIYLERLLFIESLNKIFKNKDYLQEYLRLHNIDEVPSYYFSNVLWDFLAKIPIFKLKKWFMRLSPYTIYEKLKLIEKLIFNKMKYISYIDYSSYKRLDDLLADLTLMNEISWLDDETNYVLPQKINTSLLNNSQYKFILPKKASDLLHWGLMFSNCVAQSYDDYIAGQTQILLVSKNNQKKYMLEVRNNQIVEFKAKYNKEVPHHDFVDLEKILVDARVIHPDYWISDDVSSTVQNMSSGMRKYNKVMLAFILGFFFCTMLFFCAILSMNFMMS